VLKSLRRKAEAPINIDPSTPKPCTMVLCLRKTAVLSSQLLLRSRHSYLHSSLLRCLLCNPQMPSNLQAPSAIQRANSVVGRGGYPSRAFQDDPFFILLPYCRRPLVPASAILHCGFYCVSSIAASGVINCRCRRGG
jgi:hypothetical protein